jgi:branched-chain amino acid transport system permease protein
MNIDFLATAIALTTFFGISALIALSLNLEYGVAGIPNFGKVLFVSIGAYTAGLTYTRLLPLLAGQAIIYPCGGGMADALQLRAQLMESLPLVALLNFAMTLVIAAVVGGVAGYLASYPALRLKEEWYLALVLLVAGEIVRILVRGIEPITCTTNGLSGIAQPFTWIEDVTTGSIAFMLLILAVLAVVFVYCERLNYSPYGRLLKAIRENDRVALTLGKPVPAIRGQVMFIGSAIAAIAGVFFATNLGFVSTNDYVVTLTLDIWVMVVLGGVGNNRGVLLGALIVTVLDRLTAILAIQLNSLGLEWEFNYVRYIIFGLILLFMLRFRPQGLLPERIRTTVAHDIVKA